MLMKGAGSNVIVLSGSNPPVETLLQDAFTGADTTALAVHTPDTDYQGDGWTEQAGSWQLSSNTLISVGAQPAAPARWTALFNCGLSDVRVSAKITPKSNTDYAGIFLRFNPTGPEFVCVYLRCDTDKIVLAKYTGGAWTSISEVACTLNGGTQYTILATIDENDLVTVSVDGAQKISATAYISVANSALTTHGLRSVVAGTIFDDLAVTPYNETGDSIEITSPAAYQVIQRDGSDQADIAITGTYLGHPTAIQARWGSGAWVTIDLAPANSAFSGTLVNQSAGQNTLSVRFSNKTIVVGSNIYVGIGDVFVVAGQSNAGGNGTNNQSYSHATLKAGLFGNDYEWRELADPTDDNTNQVDAVSSNTAGGSVWPLVATQYLTTFGVPVAFIPCAKGETAIASWQPGADHNDRTTLYGSMNYRATTAGGIKAVLWYQGEKDAADGTLEATYNAALDTLANAIQGDQSVKLIAAKIHDMAARDEAAVNAAITTAWGDNANVEAGPDCSDFTPDGDVHYTTDADLATLASRWWTALNVLYGA